MAHTITVTTAGNALGQYCVRYGNQINQTLRQGLEFEADLPKVSCDYAYQGQDVDVADVLQPYQKAFTPVNTETFNGPLNILQIGKVDLSFDWGELIDFYNKWMCNWFEAGKSTTEWTYPRFIMETAILPKFIDELNAASWAGEYAAPTPGTAGASLTSFDGFKKKIADAITATSLTPIATGAFVSTTMVAQITAFCAALPIRYRYVEGVIEMSKTNAQLYASDWAAKFPGREVVEKEHDKQYLRVDHFNKRIIGRTSMEGSSRIVLRFPSLPSMIIGTRTGLPVMPQFRFQEVDRELKVLSEFYRFFGIETFKHMFVNDQV